MKCAKLKKLNIAVVQISAGRDMAGNVEKIARALRRARGADLIALPEVFAIRGSDADYRRSAERIDGPLMAVVSGWAVREQAWILAGSIMEKAGNRIFNTSVLVDRAGRVRAIYRKMHLFEARLEDGRVIRESDTYSRGRRPAMAGIDGWKAGMAICYDVRFPELFRKYSDAGAGLLFLPSNFTQRTGRDHWEILVRARAIENQCFVVAPDQCGENPVTGIKSHGHSIVAGPWGEVLCEAGDGETVLRAELDPAELAATRRRVPALKHRVM